MADNEYKAPCSALSLAQAKIDKQEEMIHHHDVICAEIKVELANIRDDTSEIKGDIKIMKDKPGKRYEGIISNVSDWLIIAILAYIAANIGL